jgi:hypothetical protein
MSSLMVQLFAILLIVIFIGTVNCAPCDLATITQSQSNPVQYNWVRLPQLTEIPEITSRNLQYWQQLFLVAMQLMQQPVSNS